MLILKLSNTHTHIYETAPNLCVMMQSPGRIPFLTPEFANTIFTTISDFDTDAKF